MFVGLVPLVLALFAIARCRGLYRRFFVALGLVAFVLALGPWLWVLGQDRWQVGGLDVRIPLPYQIFERIPVLNTIRTPFRFDVLLTLALAMLGALATRRLLMRLEPRWGRASGLAFVAALMLAIPLDAQILGTHNIVDASVPTAYTVIARDGGRGAVLEVPLGGESGQPGEAFGEQAAHRELAYQQLLYQTVHGRPVLGGHLSRIRPGTIAAFRSGPGLRPFVEPNRVAASTDTCLQAPVTAQTLNEDHVEYVVVHDPYLEAPVLARLDDWLVEGLGMWPVSVGDGLHVFRRPDESRVWDGRNLGWSEWTPRTYGAQDQAQRNVGDEGTELVVSVASGRAAGVATTLDGGVAAYDGFALDLTAADQGVNLYVDVMDPRGPSYLRCRETLDGQGPVRISARFADMHTVAERPGADSPDLAHPTTIRISVDKSGGFVGSVHLDRFQLLTLSSDATRTTPS